MMHFQNTGSLIFVTFLLILVTTILSLYLQDFYLFEFGWPHYDNVSTLNLDDKVFSWVKLNDEVFLSSAYWDDRTPSSPAKVRIVGIQKISDRTLATGRVFTGLKYECYLQYRGHKYLVKGHISSQLFDESRFDFVGFFYFCEPPRSLPIPPSLVRILDPNDNRKVTLGIRLTSPKTNATRTAMCVRPIFGSTLSVKSIVQFLSHYTTFGIDHFTIYVFDPPPKVRMFLNDLKKTFPNLSLELPEWNLPHGDKAVWDHGALVALNECLYRGMSEFKYMIMVDLDEFIVPTGTDKVTSIASLVDNIPDSFGAYIVMNVFFCKEYLQETVNIVQPSLTSMIQKTNFEIFTWVKRYSKVFPNGERSKLILLSKTVEYVGHHWPNKFVEQRWTYQAVDPGVMVMNHYRLCDTVVFPGIGSINKIEQAVQDTTIFKFAEAIYSSPLISFWMDNYNKY